MGVLDPDRLLEAMRDADMDQSALARAVGCTPGAINQIINGNVERSRFIPEICYVLGVDFEWLAGASAEKRPTGTSAARLYSAEHKLIENIRSLRSRDRQAFERMASAMASVEAKFLLPNEDALARTFDGLLAPLDLTQPKAELARTLAQLLPIGLAQVEDPFLQLQAYLDSADVGPLRQPAIDSETRPQGPRT